MPSVIARSSDSRFRRRPRTAVELCAAIARPLRELALSGRGAPPRLEASILERLARCTRGGIPSVMASLWRSSSSRR
jgi:hypothetical protein